MVWSDGTSVRIGQPRMKYGWFDPPVYQSWIPASAIFKSDSVEGKSLGVKKSSGASVSQALQPDSVSAATRGSRGLRLIVCLLEADVHAEGDGARARIARVVPAQVAIAGAARADLGVVPGVSGGGEEVLAAHVEPQLTRPEAAGELGRYRPIDRHVLQPHERAVLDPARRHAAVVRPDAQAGHGIRVVGGSPVVEHRAEHVGRAARCLHAEAIQIHDLEIQGPTHDVAEGEAFVPDDAGEAKQVPGLRVPENSPVGGVDDSIAIQVPELLGARPGPGLAAAGGLDRVLEDPVPHVAIEVPQRLSDSHDRPVPDIGQRAVRTRQEKLPVRAEIQHLAAVEGQVAAQTELEWADGVTRVDGQLQPPILRSEEHTS